MIEGLIILDNQAPGQLDLGRSEEAIQFCERAIEATPDDPGLRANLALALLFSGKSGEARVVAQEALTRDAANEITAHIVRIIEEVLAVRNLVLIT